MVNQALFDVVKNQLASGVRDVEVKEFLRRRGTSEPEIKELFEALTSQSVTIRDIPVVEAAPVVAPQVAPVESAPAQSEAHGIVRDIPPLQPSTPFSPIPPQLVAPIEPSVATIIPVVTPVVFEEENVVDPGRKKTFIIAGASIIAAIVLIFGCYFVYSSYFASPENVMDTMISRLRDVRSGEFSVDMTAVTDSMSELASTSTDVNPFLKAFAIQGPVTFTMHASGTVNLLDEQKPKVALVFSATMDKWSMGDFVLGAEYRNIDRVNYVKINDVPDLGFLSLSFLKNKWFKAADSEAKAQLGTSPANTSSVIPTISQEQRDSSVTAWKINRFLIVEKTLNSEDVDGASMHHYKLAFDKEIFKKWDSEMNTILNRADTATSVAKLDEDLSLITVNNFELWIGKRDRLPHKFVINVSLQDKTDSSKKTELTLTMGGNKFNTALDVIAPEGAQSIEEAIKGIFGQMLGGNESQKPAPTTLKDRNAQRKTDVMAIANAIKMNITTNKGTFTCVAGPLPATATFIGAAGFGMSGYAIESCLVPTYLPELPRDPSKGTMTMSGYSVLYNAKTKKVTVRAPYTEGGAIISVTK